MLESRNATTRVRPDFGTTQIKNPDELVRGLLVVVRGKKDGQTYVVLNKPYNDRVRVQHYGGLPCEQIHLADHGVISYDSGAWHCNHWLQNTGRILTEDEMKGLYARS